MKKKVFNLDTVKKILIVLVGLTLGLPFVSDTCFADEDTEEEHQVIVSLGDSYSSGEGIEPFYDQYDEDGNENHVSKKVKSKDWLAHRSKKAWPGMLSLPSVDGSMAEHRDDNWFFVATSGAETKHMNDPFLKPYRKKVDDKEYVDNESDDISIPGQLSIFENEDCRRADYVTLTLGGNDVGFSDIVKACVMGCNYLEPNGLNKKLKEALEHFDNDWYDGEEKKEAIHKTREYI